MADVFLARDLRDNVAEVAGEPISPLTLSQEINRLGHPLPKGEAGRSVLLGILQQLVTQKTLWAEAQQNDIIPSDELVKDTLRQAFHDETGKFSRALLDNYTRVTGQKEDMVLEDIRHDLAKNHLLSVFYAGTYLPKEISRTDRALSSQRRRLKIAYVSAVAQPVGKKATAQELKTFYEIHKGIFEREERRSFHVLLLPYKQIVAKTHVSEKELKEAYQRSLEPKEKWDSYTFEQVTFNSEEQAKRAEALIQAGKSPQQVVKKLHGLPPALLKDIRFTALPKAYQNPLRSLKLGEAAIIKTALGWQVLYLKSKKKIVPPSFASQRKGLMQQLKKQKGRKLIEKTRQSVEDTLGAGQSLTGVARQGGYPILDFSKVKSSEYRTVLKQNALLKDVGGEILKMLPLLEAGDVSPLTTGKGFDGFYAVSMEEVIPRHIPPFKETMSQVEAAWVKDKKYTAMLQFVRASVNALNTTAMPFERLFKNKGMQIKEVGYDDEQNAKNPLYGQMIQKAFGVGIHKAVFVSNPEGTWIGYVANIRQKKTLVASRGLGSSFYRDYLMGYLSQLQKAYQVRFNPPALDVFISQ